MAAQALTCVPHGCRKAVEVSDPGTIDGLIVQLQNLYRTSTWAGDSAARYWADLAVTSRSPLAPLAHVPGVFAVLWTPDVAPTTATVLGAAGYGFAALPKNLIHFTTEAGAAGIARAGVIHASRAGSHGIYGPGVYMARIGRPLNLLIRKKSRVPIHIPTPAGTMRLYPYLAYVRLGTNGVKIGR